MKGESNKDRFNKKSKKSVPKRNYSEREVVVKIDRFSSVAKTAKQKNKMLKIRQEYYAGKEKTAVHRFIRNKNFELGKRAGLHSTKTMEDLQLQDKTQDQNRRNTTMEKAKTYYHKNYSLSKRHKETVQKSKTKPKEISKERE